MMRRTKRRVVTEFRSSAILDAARRVFARKGFTRASIDEIARAAGIAKGTVYLYYPSKRAVYWEALRRGVRDLHAETARQLDRADTFEAKLRAFALTKIRYFDEHRDFFRIYHEEMGHALSRPSLVDQEVRRVHQAQIELLVSVVRGAVRRREVRPVAVDRAAVAIFELTRGLVQQRLLESAAGDPEADASFIVDLVSRGLRIS